jgi:hypothetical protein
VAFPIKAKRDFFPLPRDRKKVEEEWRRKGNRKWIEGGIRALNICVLHVVFTS